MDLLDKVLALACDAHSGEKDASGHPEILHPLRVMSRLQVEDGIDDPVTLAAAALHDCVEDGYTTYSNISAVLYGEDQQEIDDVVYLVELLCHRKMKDHTLGPQEGEETYTQYLDRLSQDERAVRIKLADLADNIRRPHPDKLRGIIQSRYRPAEAKLRGKLNDFHSTSNSAIPVGTDGGDIA